MSLRSGYLSLRSGYLSLRAGYLSLRAGYLSLRAREAIYVLICEPGPFDPLKRSMHNKNVIVTQVAPQPCLTYTPLL
ncbi:MAG: hypothetical protein ACOX7C_07715 [Brevefilum sp.]